jgi:hypothetical protein
MTLVLLPRGARDVASNDRFQRQDLVAPHLH